MNNLIKRCFCHVTQIAFFIFVSILFSFGVPELSAKTHLQCPTRAKEISVGPIDSPAGTICGKVVTPPSSENAANAFLGIPFGKSTAGENRWAAPKKAEKSPKIIEATQFGDICPQDLENYPSLRGLPQSENCLTLNVWTPIQSQNLPVMVFIYGGGFAIGGSSFPYYNGSYIAANKNVIVVTFNYRLGAFGFLALELPPKKPGDPPVKLLGNYGFMDQQLALKWVQTNISAFGGDPKRVTIFGESSGAQSVSLHLVSAPSSKDLFRAGIMESNLLIDNVLSTLEEQTELGNIYALGLNCSDLKCLRNNPTQDLLEAQNALTFETEFPNAADYIFTPAIDGILLTKQPIEGIAKKPMLLGTNKNEAVLFTGDKPISTFQFANYVAGKFGKKYKQVYAEYSPQLNQKKKNGKIVSKLMTDYTFLCSTRYFATQSSKVNPKVFAYLFNYSPPFFFAPIKACLEDDNVCHTAELPFVFHTPQSVGGTFTPAENQLSLNMIDYWTNFAKVHNPYGSPPHPKGLIPWPNFTPEKRQYMSLNLQLSIEDDPYKEICNFWDSYVTEVNWR